MYERITVSEKSGSGGFEPGGGFEPLEFARTIKQEDQEDQLYLDVKYRNSGSVLANPLGRISSHIVWFNENVALAEAKIYLNYTDAPENYIANAFSMKFPLRGSKVWRQVPGDGRELPPWDVRSLMRDTASSLRT